MACNDIKIAPSILSADFSILGEEITKLDKTNCDYIHIDVMDGHFVPNITIGPGIISSIRPLTKKIFDVHLMINPVKSFLKDFIKAGADILTIHHEIDDDVISCLRLIKDSGLKAGISIKPNTSSNNIIQYLNYVDLILIMTVEPGFGGQRFLEEQLKKIKEIKDLIGERDIEIEVDGGINKLTARKTIEAGAKVLVSGSSIFKGNDYQKNIHELRL